MKLDVCTRDRLGQRRRWNRLKSRGGRVTLTLDSGQLLEGTVDDESFGGLGIQFPDVPPVMTGQEIEVVYNGVTLCATARHLARADDGDYRLGLEWKAVEIANRARHATAISSGERHDEFWRRLPAGLYTMWRLFEGRQWQDLSQMAHQLARDATAAELEVLVPHVDRLMRLTEQPPSKAKVRNALAELSQRSLDLVRGTRVQARLAKALA